MIAINVADLTRHDPLMTSLMLSGVTPERRLVKCGPNLDDGGVILECHDERALAIVRWFRQHDEARKRYATRAYRQGPRGGWRKL